MKNYFQKKDRKAFTIVELVIVIAVIAILAAVLIPTFSNIIKKANLNADMQACREMNMALAEYESSNGYPTRNKNYLDIETVMRVLADHGYDAKNWQPLSVDYKYLWDKELDQMVLVAKSDGTIVYPDAESYAEKGLSGISYGAGLRFQEYNQNVVAALDTNFSFSSSNASTEQISLSSGNSSLTAAQSLIASAIGGGSGVQNAGIRNALKINGSSAYIAASSVTKSSDTSTYASCESMYVTDDANFKLTADLLSTGDYAPNTYVVSVNYADNATDEEKLVAQKAAGEMIYSLFVQMNSDVIDDSASIIIPAGTVINCSSHEWRAAKSITGYFGSTDPANPVIIDGVKLSTDTGYAQTYTLAGSGSQYFITGFIGAVYGNATIENMTFKNLSINSPGADYQIAANKANRNTVGIIGGIIPNPLTSQDTGAVNVTVKNIVVEDSCSILGTASVGGIIGYIGAEQGYKNLTGTINIEGCKFAGTVQSSDSVFIADGYSPVGGIIGFNCRCGAATINVKNCEFTGTARGYGKVGGLVGDAMEGPTYNVTNTVLTGTGTNLGNCTSAYKKDGKTATNYANYGKIGVVCGGVKATINLDTATVSSSAITASNCKGEGTGTINGISG